ncbi:hypothetical protein [Halonotius pteroides]|nr:hypothetical protein [Halonotius pteroides]
MTRQFLTSRSDSAVHTGLTTVTNGRLDGVFGRMVANTTRVVFAG